MNIIEAMKHVKDGLMLQRTSNPDVTLVMPTGEAWTGVMNFTMMDVDFFAKDYEVLSDDQRKRIEQEISDSQAASDLSRNRECDKNIEEGKESTSDAHQFEI